MMVGLVRSIVFLVMLLMASANDARASSNADIVALSRAKAGDEVIIASIAKEPCDYQLGVEHIVKLRKVGVSSPVIAAMIRRCRLTPGNGQNGEDPDVGRELRAGLYAVDSVSTPPKFDLIVPAFVTPGRSGGNGSFLFPDRSKISLPRERSALLVASRRPVFWIVVDTAAVRLNHEVGDIPSGFEDIQLMRLERKAGKRQLQTSSAANGGVMSGIDPRKSVPIRVSRKSSSIYVVSLESDIEIGDYAFMTGSMTSAYRMYDFTFE